MKRLLACAAAAGMLFASSCAYREPGLFSDEMREVPDVLGEVVQDAREELEAAGFLVRIIPEGATPPPPVIEDEPEGKCASGTVVGQDPTPEEDAVKASTVVLVARGC